jgi:Bacterial conjugation TrbI-like protein
MGRDIARCIKDGARLAGAWDVLPSARAQSGLSAQRLLPPGELARTAKRSCSWCRFPARSKRVSKASTACWLMDAPQDPLIPQGARLVGQYDAQISFGQTRALLVWNRLIMPNGRSIVLERQLGADPEGYAGLRGRGRQPLGHAVQGGDPLHAPQRGIVNLTVGETRIGNIHSENPITRATACTSSGYQAGNCSTSRSCWG